MMNRASAQAVAVVFFALTGALGCGPQFDSPAKVKSLRILAVQKDKPYALKGDTVSLTMAWHDGSPKVDPKDPDQRRVQLGWFGPCVNPPLDSYASCGAAIARQTTNCKEGDAECDPSVNPDLSDDPRSGVGPTFQVTVPDRADTLHPNQDPKLPDYGVIYVFFAACAGSLGHPADPSFPASCYAASDEDETTPLGPDDFVAGYSSIYVFPTEKNYRNKNPVVTGFATQGRDETEVSCVGEACLGTCDEMGCINQPPAVDTSDADAVNAYCAAHPRLCVPTCKDDGDPLKCTGYQINPSIDKEASVEADAITNDAYGHQYQEQMWINYYSSRGEMNSPTRLLNDATAGWNGNFSTKFFAPSAPGPVQLWAAVHDNRGGVAWSGLTMVVR